MVDVLDQMRRNDVWSVRLFFCLGDIGGIELYSVDGTLYENLEGREFVFQSEHTNRPTELFLQVDEFGEIYYDDDERRRERVARICRMEVLSRTVTVDNDQRRQLVARPSASLGNGFNQIEQMARGDVWSVRLFLGIDGVFEFLCVDGTLYENLDLREFVFQPEHTNRQNPREWFLHLSENGDIYFVAEGERELVAKATRMEVLSRTVTVDNAPTRRAQSPRRTTAEAVRAVFGEDISSESEDEIDDSATSEDEINDSEEREIYAIMDGSASASSSTPRPARGQLWRHRLDRTYAVVTNLYRGRVTINANALVLGTSTVSDFVRENDYIGEFNGSRWSYVAVDRNIILTVRLNEDNSVTAMYRSGSETETFNFQYVAFYLEKVNFRSAGPASAVSAPPRLSEPDPIGVAGGSDEESAGAGGEATSSSSTSRRTKRKRISEREPQDEEEKTTMMAKELSKAMRNKEYETVKKLFREKYDINTVYERSVKTALSYAIILLRDTKLIKLLIDLGANLDVEFSGGGSYLSFAVGLHDNDNFSEDEKAIKILKLLLERGARVKNERQWKTLKNTNFYLAAGYKIPDDELAHRLVEIVKYNSVEQSTCSICLDPLGGYAPFVIKLSCGHMFHKKCIQYWAGRSTRRYYFECPLCKKLRNKSELNGDGDIFVAVKTDADGNIVYKLRNQLLKF